MAKSRKSVQSSAEALSDTSSHVRVNLDDQNALRCHLDEAAAEVIRQSGYKEYFTVMYVKIVLGVASIGLALYAQFGPGKFPTNWWTVVLCVIGYLVATAALNLYCYMFEKDNFLICYQPKGDCQSAKLYVSSHMERYSDVYELKLRSAVSGGRNREIKLKKTSVTKYFHSDGLFAEEIFKRDVLQLLETYQQQKPGGSSSGSDIKKVR